MAENPKQQEVWLRGPLPGFDPMLMPVAHALVQAKEDILALAARVPPDDVWARPGGAASVGYHIRHLAGSVDRLFTYARGETLTDQQRASLGSERVEGAPLQTVAAEAVATLERALEQLRHTSRDQLLEPRKVGRAGLPSNVLGLLFHAAEHTTRHAGQALTTAKILAAS